MYEILTALLFSLATASLLATVALVFYILQPMRSPRLGDEESFSSMAVKESRKLGLWPDSRISGSSTSTLQLQPSRFKTKKAKKKKTETKTAEADQSKDITWELRMLKHMEIVKWRQDNKRVLSELSDSFLSTQSPQTAVEMPTTIEAQAESAKSDNSPLSDKTDTSQSNDVGSAGSE
ncbi:hypothetical protein BOX15_Mlig023354g2 [Macrostomum lignano]|uniref:Uncharacterized protein n=1 Tax=Macrostomum lignano TaxID=282301 RepID=A0A267DZW5_9PLAT|nr:hypothetical protein BOX15_Mlig023354g3 [Macrostomum lignano]PAA90756.1 hypothetical protein BOX15_Mlig023354g2 [Macrostomum lignano]